MNTQMNTKPTGDNVARLLDTTSLADDLAVERAVYEMLAADGNIKAEEQLLVFAELDRLVTAWTGLTLDDCAAECLTFICAEDWVDYCQEVAIEAGHVDPDNPMFGYIDWHEWSNTMAADAYQLDVYGSFGVRTYLVA